MTDALAPVLIPYARFLECRERRLGMSAELTRQDGPCTVDAEVLPTAAAEDDVLAVIEDDTKKAVAATRGTATILKKKKK